MSTKEVIAEGFDGKLERILSELKKMIQSCHSRASNIHQISGHLSTR
jgi:hypothetical protein